ncbi:MAG TPA: oligogalacturonate lyase family protein [Bryobacteraceae bacterium]|nr:oligogalacturonate lyase family protein [Bryobacteraceae bacterium]
MFFYRNWKPIGVIVVTAFGAVAKIQAQAPPDSWVDPDTHHRVVRLTREPDSASLYFNQNGYTADGKRMVYTTPDGISVVDLKTLQARQLVQGKVRVIVTGRKHNRVFYIRNKEVFSTDLDTNQEKRLGAVPKNGSIATVNADETLLGGTYIEGEAGNTPYTPSAAPARSSATSSQVQTLDQPKNKGQMMEQRLAAHLPMAMFVLNTQTGETRVIHRSTDWLNHLEFSPTDPALLMFCHEGPWHKVDRIWTIRTDGSGVKKIHTRTMEMEIFGHEFWSEDGKTIWYDLQTPRGEDFWLAGYDVATGERRQYHLQRDEWSIHFNVSRDNTLMTGDGGDPGQVAHAKDGQWIYLFRPELNKSTGVAGNGLIRPGVLHAERLVNMSKHQYRLEPNVSFTPDGQWVVFRSNMFGKTYAFAVEVAKSGEQASPASGSR